MTKGQRIEYKFGNAARELVAARKRYTKAFGFIHTATCAGLMPRYRRWKERLEARLRNLRRA